MAEYPLIPSRTPAQAQLEEELTQRLARVETDTVRAMAAEGASLPEIAGNAAWFAEAMTQKHRHPQSPPVACRAGCSHCCHQSVALTAAEAARVARFIRGNEATRPALTARLKALDAKTRGLSPLQRVALREPCALLEDGRCQVYPARPLACAEFTSYDVEACKAGLPTAYLQSGVIHETARLIAHRGVYRGLASGLAAAYPKADVSSLELTAAVLAFLDDPALEQEWTEGKDLSACHFNAGDSPAR